MEKIADKLNNINCTLEKMLEVINKPEHLLQKFLTIAGMIGGILGIITIIDIMMNWF
jgi:hypothetical protein